MKAISLLFIASSTLALSVPARDHAIQVQARDASTPAPQATESVFSQSSAAAALPTEAVARNAYRTLNASTGLNTPSPVDWGNAIRLPTDFSGDLSNYTHFLNFCDIFECSESESDSEDEDVHNTTSPAVSLNVTKRAERWQRRLNIVKRGDREMTPFKDFPKFVLESRPYRKPYEMYAGKRLKWNVENYHFENPYDDMDPRVYNTEHFHTSRQTDTEHLIEIKTLSLFLQHLGRNSKTVRANLAENFLSPITNKELFKEQFPWAKALLEAKPDATFGDAWFTTVGSKQNEEANVLADSGINNMKAKAWNVNNLVGPKAYKQALGRTLVGSQSSNEVKLMYKTALGIANYFNHPTIKQKLSQIEDEQIKLLNLFTPLTDKRIEVRKDHPINLAQEYERWLKDHIQHVEKNASKWFRRFVGDTKSKIKTRIDMMTVQADALAAEELKNGKDPKKHDKYWNKVSAAQKQAHADLTAANERFHEALEKYNKQRDSVDTIDEYVLMQETATERDDKRKDYDWQVETKTLEKLTKDLKKKGRELFQLKYKLDTMTSRGIRDRISGFEQDMEDFDKILAAGQHFQVPDFTKDLSRLNICKREDKQCNIEDNEMKKSGIGGKITNDNEEMKKTEKGKEAPKQPQEEIPEDQTSQEQLHSEAHGLNNLDPSVSVPRLPQVLQGSRTGV